MAAKYRLTLSSPTYTSRPYAVDTIRQSREVADALDPWYLGEGGMGVDTMTLDYRERGHPRRKVYTRDVRGTWHLELLEKESTA